MAFDAFLYVFNNLMYSFLSPLKIATCKKKIKGNEFSEMTDCFIILF